MNIFVTKQSGAVEACWAHNPEVRRSKLRSANKFFLTNKKAFLPFLPSATIS
jgi:hypothetical protein